MKKGCSLIAPSGAKYLKYHAPMELESNLSLQIFYRYFALTQALRKIYFCKREGKLLKYLAPLGA
jgi:hypothetical protein